MVAAEPEARPYWVLLTELMMVFMLGEENKANPNPIHINMKTIKKTEVLSERNTNAASPAYTLSFPM